MLPHASHWQNQTKCCCFFPDRLNSERRTALHLAAASGTSKCTEQLLSSGALPDLRDWHGETPLLLASEQGCESVVALLIKEGCDIRATNDSGWNALHLAIKKGHCNVAHRLIAAGKIYVLYPRLLSDLAENFFSV